MFLVILEASNAFKLMFVHALVIQKPSQIDPGSIWEKSFFHENFQKFDPHEEVEFLKNSYVYPNPGQSESSQTSTNLKSLDIMKFIKFYRLDFEKIEKQN